MSTFPFEDIGYGCCLQGQSAYRARFLPSKTRALQQRLTVSLLRPLLLPRYDECGDEYPLSASCFGGDGLCHLFMRARSTVARATHAMVAPSSPPASRPRRRCRRRMNGTMCRLRPSLHDACRLLRPSVREGGRRRVRRRKIQGREGSTEGGIYGGRRSVMAF